eukprot:53599-Rhodomonas_salina.1
MRTRDVLQGFRAPVPFGGFLYLQGNSMVSTKNFRIRLCRGAGTRDQVRLPAGAVLLPPLARPLLPIKSISQPRGRA